MGKMLIVPATKYDVDNNVDELIKVDQKPFVMVCHVTEGVKDIVDNYLLNNKENGVKVINI